MVPTFLIPPNSLYSLNEIKFLLSSSLLIPSAIRTSQSLSILSLWCGCERIGFIKSNSLNYKLTPMVTALGLMTTRPRFVCFVCNVGDNLPAASSKAHAREDFHLGFRSQPSKQQQAIYTTTRNNQHQNISYSSLISKFCKSSTVIFEYGAS